MHINLFKKFQTYHCDAFKVQITKFIDLHVSFINCTENLTAHITALRPLKPLFSFVPFYNTIA